MRKAALTAAMFLLTGNVMAYTITDKNGVTTGFKDFPTCHYPSYRISLRDGAKITGDVSFMADESGYDILFWFRDGYTLNGPAEFCAPIGGMNDGWVP